jgi:hypothetical protein
MKLVNQQIIISGVGGQGVLFVTRLKAQTAKSPVTKSTPHETPRMMICGFTNLNLDFRF